MCCGVLCCHGCHLNCQSKKKTPLVLFLRKADDEAFHTTKCFKNSYITAWRVRKYKSDIWIGPLIPVFSFISRHLVWFVFLNQYFHQGVLAENNSLHRKTIYYLNYFIITPPEWNGCAWWICDSHKLSAWVCPWILVLNLNVNITYNHYVKSKNLIGSKSVLKSIYNLSFHTLANFKHLSSLYVK